MAGLVAVIYGVVAYSFTLAALLYLIGFVGNLIVPKSIDSGTPGPLLESVIVNTMLIGLFAIQHSVMARQALQALVDADRAALGRAQHLRPVRQFRRSLILYWQWQPIPEPVWTVHNTDRRLRCSKASSGWAGSCWWPARF